MIAQMQPISNGFIHIISGAVTSTATSMYHVPRIIYMQQAETNHYHNDSEVVKTKVYTPSPLHLQGRATSNKKRLIVFQRVQPRRNRNLHIQ